MSANLCGLGAGGGQWPDVGNGEAPCCWESALDGPARCSCWEPVFDLEQQEPQRDLEPGTRPSMCVDCAYRPSSPERTGDPDAGTDVDELRALVDSGSVFWCHQGMRRPIHWRHPSGATTVPAGMDLNYRPPIVDGRPFKADGTPGDICGGWAALRLKVLAKGFAS
jgi:hypothetical protein